MARGGPPKRTAAVIRHEAVNKRSAAAALEELADKRNGAGAIYAAMAISNRLAELSLWIELLVTGHR